jgi:hypothetical protein
MIDGGPSSLTTVATRPPTTARPNTPTSRYPEWEGALHGAGVNTPHGRSRAHLDDPPRHRGKHLAVGGVGLAVLAPHGHIPPAPSTPHLCRPKQNRVRNHAPRARPALHSAACHQAWATLRRCDSKAPAEVLRYSSSTSWWRLEWEIWASSAARAADRASEHLQGGVVPPQQNRQLHCVCFAGSTNDCGYDGISIDT